MTEQAPNVPEFPSGTVVGGKYRVERLVGYGGMGAVYAGRHVGTGRGIALKFLLADEPDLRRRMQREALALGALAHPNVVNVFDVGEHAGSVFLVMELLAGKNLREYVDGRILGPAEAVALILPALQGVEAAHRAGILHRDLKPDNLFVLVDDEGVAFDTKVLDFGIARPLGAGGPGIEITRSGAVVGTPKYMSPEQLRGSRELGPEVDVFAAGLMLYELVVGRSPYAATSYESLIIEIATQLPISPKQFAPDLPDEFVAIVLRALEKRPSDRFATVLEFARALEPFAPGIRFVVPRKAQLGSLVDSEESAVSLGEPTAPQFSAWSESAGSRTAATKEDRPRHVVVSDDALAATAAPAVGPNAIPETTGSLRATLPTRGAGMALGLAAIVAVGIATVAYVSLSPTAVSDVDAAIDPASTELSTPSSATAPIAMPPPPLLADAPDGTHLDPVVAPEPEPTANATDERRARARPNAAGSTSDEAPAAPTIRAEPAPATEPAGTMATTEARGRAGTIRVDDF